MVQKKKQLLGYGGIFSHISLCTVSESSTVLWNSIPSSAACMLLPMISPLDVHMLIERELTKTSESTSAPVDRANHLTDSKMSLLARKPNTVELRSLSKTDIGGMVPPLLSSESSQGLGSDNCDTWHTQESLLNCAVKKVETGNVEDVCSVGQSGKEQSLCCKSDVTASLKIPDTYGVAAESDSSLPVHCADGYTNLSLESSMLCKRRLSSHEINNNYRRGYVGSVHSKKTINNVMVGRDAVLRKSKRCNRGRRYNELMSQGVFQHQSRRRSESSTL